MSPEKLADLEKERYLNAVEEQRKVRELANVQLNKGLDGKAAWIRATVEYDEKYPEQLAYDIELNARLAYERGKNEGIIVEAHERSNKYNYFWESSPEIEPTNDSTKELENE